MPDDENLLVPTKATLFGLDIRFRAIDKRLEDDKRNLALTCLTQCLGRKHAFKSRTRKIMMMNTDISTGECETATATMDAAI